MLPGIRQPGRFTARLPKIIRILALCFFTLNLSAQPVINSISPASGPAGITVTINGNGFSTDPAANFVYFGPVAAKVLTAAGNQLTVQVPNGAASQALTVSVNRRTAYSAQSFRLIFAGAAAHFTRSSFVYSGPLDTTDQNTETTRYAIGDFNGDGSIDAATIDRLNNQLSVYSNQSAGNPPSFGSAVLYPTGENPRSITAGDIDGDGKLDLIVSNLKANTISIYKNTSLSGYISFAAKIDFPTADQPSAIRMADLDADGRPDLVVNTINLDGYISILQNTSSGSGISFNPPINLSSPGGSIEEVEVADLDGDAKPDIALPNFSLGAISLFRNNCSVGNISFATRTDLSAGAYPYVLRIGDLNNDGKPELAVGYYLVNNDLTIFKNNGTPGNISFESATHINNPASVDQIGLCDLDGDGTRDLVVKSATEYLSLYKNISLTGGGITFEPEVRISNYWNGQLEFPDFDLDGLPDIAIESGFLRTTFWKNRTNAPQITSFTPAIAGAGTAITITGENLSNADLVQFGDMAASAFTVENSNRITAIVSNGSNGAITVTTPKGTDTIEGFTYVPPPQLTGFSPVIGGIGTNLTITGNHLAYTANVLTGAAPAKSFLSISDTDLRAVLDSLGEDEQMVDIKISTPGGVISLPGFHYMPPPVIQSFTPADGITGSVVHIYGKNFSNATQVRIGDSVLTNFMIVSDTEISVVVPYAATGPIYVRNDYGTAVRNGFYFKGPVIESFSPAAAKSGDEVIITGRNFTRIDSVFFGETAATSFQLINNSSIKAVIDTGSTGDIRIVSGLGFSTKNGFLYYPKPYIDAFSPSSGNAGSRIRITGRNFDLVDSVRFGGIPAVRVEQVSSTEMVVVVGNGNSGSVEVVTKGGAQTLSGFTYLPTPVIQSVSPASGRAGSIITITGDYFAPSPQDNIVYIGGEKASVVSATASTLMVTVPTGATSDRLSVTVNQLTAFSPRKFIITYPNGQPVTAATFTLANSVVASAWPSNLLAADMDGDGKPDLVSANQYDYEVTVIKNASTIASIQFADPLLLDIADWRYGLSMAEGDFDGDGMHDLVVVNPQTQLLDVFKNNSSAGQLAFKPEYETYGQNIVNVKVGDIDQDGRPDLVITQGWDRNYVFVYRNTSAGGTISFEPLVGFSIGLTPQALVLADLDGDLKTDIATANYGSSSVSILRNTSTAGLISFAPTITISGKVPKYITADDLDNDGKPELIVANYNDRSFSVLQNRSTAGNILFTLQAEYETLQYPIYLASGDLNGDGKLELLAGHEGSSFISVYNNNSSTQAISLSPKIDFPIPTNANSIVVVDLNGDRIPEIASTNMGSYTVAVLQNQVVTAIDPVPGEALGIHLYPNPNKGLFRVDGLKLADQWETFQVYGPDGRLAGNSLSVRGKTQLDLNLSFLPAGPYTVTITRKNGRLVMMRFMKL